MREREARLAPFIGAQLKARRWGKLAWSWYMDDTYVKVSGTWCYLYRAIDRDGNLVDCRRSRNRDIEAGKAS